MKLALTGLIVLLGTLVVPADEEKSVAPDEAKAPVEKKAYDAEAEAKKPLVLIIGDSVSVGAGRPDYKKSADFTPRIGRAKGDGPGYGYVEALCEATFDQDVPCRFDKLAAGGMSISGKYAGLKGSFRSIFEKRHKDIKELPAILIYQDFQCMRTPEEIAAHKAAIKEIHEWSKKEPTVRLVFSTVAWESGGTFSKGYPDEDLRKSNEATLEVTRELGIPVIRLDQAWERYREHIKDRKDSFKLMITFQGKYMDGVHPGRIGQFFQAVVFARELGIPAEKFNEKAKVLDVDPELAADIEKFVYSWTEPTVVKQPEAKK